MASIETQYGWMTKYRFSIERSGFIISELVDGEEPVPREQLEAALTELSEKISHMVREIFQWNIKVQSIAIRGPLLDEVGLGEEGRFDQTSNVRIPMALHLLQLYKSKLEGTLTVLQYDAKMRYLTEKFYSPIALCRQPQSGCVSKAFVQPTNEWRAAVALCKCAKKARVEDKRSRSPEEDENRDFIEELRRSGIVLVTDGSVGSEEVTTLRKYLRDGEPLPVNETLEHDGEDGPLYRIEIPGSESDDERP